MFSPIRCAEIDVEACRAHLIPEKLEVSNATVLSERHYDNEMGSRNDEELIRYVRNRVDPEKDAVIEFYDPTRTKILHKSPLRTRTTLTRGPSGLREGQISLPQVDEKLKTRIGLGIGANCYIRMYSPTPEGKCRIGLSMLHSGYLTMYYHFHCEYIAQDSLRPLRAVLANSVQRHPPVQALSSGFRQFQATSAFIRGFPQHFLTQMFADLRTINPHSVGVWRWPGFACFAALLPYHPQYGAVCLLPGWGHQELQQFQFLLTMIERQGSIPLPSNFTSWGPSTGETAEGLWHRALRSSAPSGQLMGRHAQENDQRMVSLSSIMWSGS